VWKPRPIEAFAKYSAYVMWNARYANRVAGHITPRGYRKIAIFKKPYFAHRIIWAYHHGWWPETVDHKNCKFADNRLSNLRVATQMENRWNSKLREKTKSNVKGVYKRKEKFYEAHVCANYKRYYLGRFVRKSDAVRAVTTARKALHKTFARSG